LPEACRQQKPTLEALGASVKRQSRAF